MPFVFAAHKLPFDTVTPDYAAALCRARGDGGCGLAHDQVAHLSLWHQCMLVAVLPVIQQRDARSNNNSNDAKASNSNDATQHTTLSEVTQEQVTLAMRIVEQLDELDVMHEDMQTRATAPRDVYTTPEEQQYDEAMQHYLLERIAQRTQMADDDDDDDDDERSETSNSHDSAAHDDDCSSRSSDSATAHDGVVHLAMCFTDDGDSIGVGTTGVFGRHGYHA